MRLDLGPQIEDLMQVVAFMTGDQGLVTGEEDWPHHLVERGGCAGCRADCAGSPEWGVAVGRG